MKIRFKLDEIIDSYDNETITRNKLAVEAKVRPNVVYELCENKTMRIELKTFEKIMIALCEILERKVKIEEVIEFTNEKEKPNS